MFKLNNSNLRKIAKSILLLGVALVFSDDCLAQKRIKYFQGGTSYQALKIAPLVPLETSWTRNSDNTPHKSSPGLLLGYEKDRISEGKRLGYSYGVNLGYRSSIRLTETRIRARRINPELFFLGQFKLGKSYSSTDISLEAGASVSTEITNRIELTDAENVQFSSIMNPIHPYLIGGISINRHSLITKLPTSERDKEKANDVYYSKVSWTLRYYHPYKENAFRQFDELKHEEQLVALRNNRLRSSILFVSVAYKFSSKGRSALLSQHLQDTDFFKNNLETVARRFNHFLPPAWYDKIYSRVYSGFSFSGAKVSDYRNLNAEYDSELEYGIGYNIHVQSFLRKVNKVGRRVNPGIVLSADYSWLSLTSLNSNLPLLQAKRLSFPIGFRLQSIRSLNSDDPFWVVAIGAGLNRYFGYESSIVTENGSLEFSKQEINSEAEVFYFAKLSFRHLFHVQLRFIPDQFSFVEEGVDLAKASQFGVSLGIGF